MKLAAGLATLLGLVSMLLVGAREVWDYEENHKPEFLLIQAEVLFQRCIRDCHEVCKANGIKAVDCKCSHCRKYIDD